MKSNHSPNSLLDQALEDGPDSAAWQKGWKDPNIRQTLETYQLLHHASQENSMQLDPHRMATLQREFRQRHGVDESGTRGLGIWIPSMLSALACILLGVLFFPRVFPPAAEPQPAPTPVLTELSPPPPALEWDFDSKFDSRMASLGTRVRNTRISGSPWLSPHQQSTPDLKARIAQFKTDLNRPIL